MDTMIIWKYYYQYLKNYYANFTDDSNQWQDIIDNILEDYNGNSGSIYRHLKSKDHDCKYIIPNDKYSQVKWANQFDQKYNNWSDDILLSQIKYYTPEVILLDIGAYNSSNIIKLILLLL